MERDPKIHDTGNNASNGAKETQAAPSKGERQND